MRRGLDFVSEDFFRNPATMIDELRAEGPLVQVRFPIIGTVWLTTTQEVASRVLKDTASFSMRKDGGFAGLQWWMPGMLRVLASNMLTMDEPDHTRLRNIVDEAFRRRAIIEMEPRVAAIADKLAADLFADGSPADIVERFARRLPLEVICELLGLPRSDRSKFTRWAGRITDISGVGAFFMILPGIWATKRYLEHQLDLVRKNGGEGLIAELVRAEKEGADISRDEMVAMVFLLLFAGHETTTHLISGSVYEILREPKLRDWLIEEPSRIDLATEEFLRFVSPVQFSKPRFARKDIAFDGVKVKQGDMIMAGIAAANLDPVVIEDPKTLDLERKPNRHVALGTGIHFCLGHQLARIEGRCAINALLARWPRLTLAVDASNIHWRRRPGMRAIAELPVIAKPD